MAMTPAAAITILTLTTGIAGGLGQIILTKSVEKEKSVDPGSVIMASILIATISIGAVLIVKGSSSINATRRRK